MASVTEVRLVDDIDGGEADETVAFDLDGKNYEIDLSENHAAKLREVLAPYAAAAGASPHPSSAGADQSGIAPAAARPDAQTGSGADGALPSSLLSSSTSTPSAAVGVLLAAVALVLLAARRRILQNALPASPVFDTDTSPA